MTMWLLKFPTMCSLQDFWQFYTAVYRFEKLEKLQMSAAQRLIASIPFRLTAFISNTYRCLYINFLNNWICFKIAKKILNWLDKDMAVSYGPIGTQCIWNFPEILLLSGKTIDF